MAYRESDEGIADLAISFWADVKQNICFSQ
jgi:hypothetical protein